MLGLPLSFSGFSVKGSLNPLQTKVLAVCAQKQLRSYILPLCPVARGGTNRVVGKPWFCPLPKRGRFDENGENDEFPFDPLERKRHININQFSGDCLGGGGLPTGWARGLPTSGQGSKVYVLCAEPKEHKHFRSGTRPGGLVTGVTEKLFMCQMCMCLFRPLYSLKTRASLLRPQK